MSRFPFAYNLAEFWRYNSSSPDRSNLAESTIDSDVVSTLPLPDAPGRPLGAGTPILAGEAHDPGPGNFSTMILSSVQSAPGAYPDMPIARGGMIIDWAVWLERVSLPNAVARVQCRYVAKTAGVATSGGSTLGTQQFDPIAGAGGPAPPDARLPFGQMQIAVSAAVVPGIGELGSWDFNVSNDVVMPLGIWVPPGYAIAFESQTVGAVQTVNFHATALPYSVE